MLVSSSPMDKWKEKGDCNPELMGSRLQSDGSGVAVSNLAVTPLCIVGGAICLRNREILYI